MTGSKTVTPEVVLQHRKEIIGALPQNPEVFSFRHDGNEFVFCCFCQRLGLNKPGLILVKHHNPKILKEKILEQLNGKKKNGRKEANP
jgi:hypothetical protein